MKELIVVAYLVEEEDAPYIDEHLARLPGAKLVDGFRAKQSQPMLMGYFLDSIERAFDKEGA